VIGLGKDDKQKHQHDEQDNEEVERVFITDEDGVEHEYEVIMYLEPDNSAHKYVILLPVDSDDEEEAEVVPFRYTEEGEELQLFPLESEEEWQMVEETFYALYDEGDEHDDLKT
jgi:uncharacterized protein YrzB (UPF0473 family)